MRRRSTAQRKGGRSMQRKGGARWGGGGGLQARGTGRQGRLERRLFLHFLRRDAWGLTGYAKPHCWWAPSGSD